MEQNQREQMRQVTRFITANHSANPERGLPLEGVPNARELGGLVMRDGRRIRQGKLLRTAYLGRATDRDIARLRDEYRLALIIDLRSMLEHEADPDREVPGAREYWADLSASQIDSMMKKTGEAPLSGGDMAGQMLRMLVNPEFQDYMRNFYVRLVSHEGSQRAMDNILHEMLSEEGGTILWHCTQGKDRCGLLSAVILALLGADRKTILHDFDLSNTAYAGLLEQMKKQVLSAHPDQAAMDTLQACIGVRVSNMELALDWIDRQYGSTKNYITQALHVTEEEQVRFQAWYLK